MLLAKDRYAGWSALDGSKIARPPHPPLQGANLGHVRGVSSTYIPGSHAPTKMLDVICNCGHHTKKFTRAEVRAGVSWDCKSSSSLK